MLIFDLEKSIILPQIVPRKWSAPKDLSQTIFQQQRKSKSLVGKTQRFKTSIEQKWLFCKDVIFAFHSIFDNQICHYLSNI